MTDRFTSRRWMDEGTALVSGVVARLGDADAERPSLLPGWTRKHVMAHLAANAEALSRLAMWAHTGVTTPMYASSAAREADIQAGAAARAAILRSRLRQTSDDIAGRLDRLTASQWLHLVATAQGRVVPATEIPWLRAREVMVHAVDLDLGIEFADLPADFLVALCADIVARRMDVPDVAGPIAERAAWLAGRPHHLLDDDGTPVASLPAWL